MKFHRVESDANYPVVKLVSENGVYELGVYPVLYGVRVRAGRAGENFVDIDYCAGDDQIFMLQLFGVVMQILESFPEEATSGEICAIMPNYHVRPINLDPCWDKLQTLAKHLTEKQDAA